MTSWCPNCKTRCCEAGVGNKPARLSSTRLCSHSAISMASIKTRSSRAVRPDEVNAIKKEIARLEAKAKKLDAREKALAQREQALRKHTGVRRSMPSLHLAWSESFSRRYTT